MKTQKSIVTVLVSLLTVVGGALIAQQGGMGGFQMPSEEEMKEMMKAQAEQSAKVAMEEFDEDDDDSLSLDEFKKMLEEMETEIAEMAKMMPAAAKLGAPEGETDEEKADRMKKVFEGADGDDDDSISLDESVAYQMEMMEKSMKVMRGEDIDEEEESDDEESDAEDEEEEG